ncbi:MAG: class I SAM-dependent methyltransferase [Christensenellaceae bacterium]
MLSSNGFDLWADGYDKSVISADEANEYPFAGYKSILNEIYNIVRESKNRTVLDVGFGTGILAQKLYANGYTIFGIDFSSKMIDIAKIKMPNATLIQYDFSLGLPKELSDKRFDCIVSTYAIHHLTDSGKADFIKELLEHLNKNGEILIGDVAFKTRAELENFKIESDVWDDDESYIVFDDLEKVFPNASFNKFSCCSGLIRLTK